MTKLRSMTALAQYCRTAQYGPNAQRHRRRIAALPIGDRALGPHSIIADADTPVRAKVPAKCAASRRDRATA